MRHPEKGEIRSRRRMDGARFRSVRTPNKNVFCETLITMGDIYIYPFNKPYFSMGVA